MARKIFQPLNMPGIQPSSTKSAIACQHRCKIMEGCAHFSWWENGNCHVQDHAATEHPFPDHVVSGPPECPKGKYCYENAVTYQPLDMNEELATDEESAAACQERCAHTPECVHFVFLADGSCHIQDAKSWRETAEADATAGPVVCDQGAPQDSPALFIVRKFSDGIVWDHVAAVAPWTIAGGLLLMPLAAAALVLRRKSAQPLFNHDGLPMLLAEDSRQRVESFDAGESL